MTVLLTVMIDPVFLAKHVLFCKVVLNDYSNTSVIYTGCRCSEIKSQLFTKTLPQHFSPSGLAKALHGGKSTGHHDCFFILGAPLAAMSLGHRTEWIPPVFSKLLIYTTVFPSTSQPNSGMLLLTAAHCHFYVRREVNLSLLGHCKRHTQGFLSHWVCGLNIFQWRQTALYLMYTGMKEGEFAWRKSFKCSSSWITVASNS